MTYTRTYRRRYSRRSGTRGSKGLWIALIIGALLLAGHAKGLGKTGVTTTTATAGQTVTTAQARTEQAYAQRIGHLDSAQSACLGWLWTEESGWSAYSVNQQSGAYGIPQALGHGHPFNLGDWRAQIRWGLRYIKGRYGTPCAAWAFERSHTPNWY